jgi:hypothetical protein
MQPTSMHPSLSRIRLRDSEAACLPDRPIRHITRLAFYVMRRVRGPACVTDGTWDAELVRWGQRRRLLTASRPPAQRQQSPATAAPHQKPVELTPEIGSTVGLVGRVAADSGTHPFRQHGASGDARARPRRGEGNRQRIVSRAGLGREARRRVGFSRWVLRLEVAGIGGRHVVAWPAGGGRQGASLLRTRASSAIGSAGSWAQCAVHASDCSGDGAHGNRRGCWICRGGGGSWVAAAACRFGLCWAVCGVGGVGGWRVDVALECERPAAPGV